MKFKAFITLVLASFMAASAQSQGYKDGIDYYKAGQYENARTIFNKTISNAGSDKALVNYYLGQAELELGNKQAALKNFQEGIATDPENPYNYVGVGALDLLNGDAQAAAAQFKSAQKFAKKNHEIIVEIARAYYNANPVLYKKEIDKYLEKARKDSKNAEPSIYIFEGDMSLDKGDYGEAARQYEMAISYNDASPEGYVKYANSFFRVNPQFSIQKLKEFLEKAPNSALAQRELAEKYYDANYWKAATDLYEQYMRNPNHFPEDKARYSVLLYWAEDYPNSLRVANEVINEQPGNVQAQRMRFIDEVVLEKYDDAVKHGEEYFAKNPNVNFSSLDFISLGNAYDKIDRKDEAIETYKKGVKAMGKNADEAIAFAAKVNPEKVYLKEQADIAVDKAKEQLADIYKELSSAYNAQKMYYEAAQAFEGYMNNVKKLTLTDQYMGAGRWLNAAATAGDNVEIRTEGSQKGLALIENLLEADPSDVDFHQRKARLIMAGNMSKPNQEAVDSYLEMINLLDADPSNMDPANPKNQLETYREGYLFIIQFYKDIEPDKDKVSTYSTKLLEVMDAMGQ